MKRGTRNIDFDIDIGVHELVKKLANGCTPPMSQGTTINLLLQLGINAFIISKQNAEIANLEEEKNELDNKTKDLDKFIKEAKKKGGDNMPSNTVLINGVIEYIVGDSKMDAVMAVLNLASSDVKNVGPSPEGCQEVSNDETEQPNQGGDDLK